MLTPPLFTPSSPSPFTIVSSILTHSFSPFHLPHTTIKLSVSRPSPSSDSPPFFSDQKAPQTPPPTNLGFSFPNPSPVPKQKIMKPPFPSLTATWHNTPYPSISPTNPSHSHATQTIVITGAGTGIGRATALAYAAAGAARLVLLGRREEMLKETASLVEKEHEKCEVQIHSVNATVTARMKEVASAVGGWDVLVLCAGRAARPQNVEDADSDLWWDVFETNVRGFFTTTHVFLPTRRPNARILGVSAAIVNLPPVYPPCHGASAYATSKLAQIRLLEHIAAECPDVFVVSVHPGIVATDLMRETEMGTGAGEGTPIDDVQLPAQFFVWATSPDAAFLRGKWVYANWDVEELKARAKEIEETHILTANVLGWPFEAK